MRYPFKKGKIRKNKVKIKAEAVLRQIAGDYVLVPTGQTMLDNNGLFALTEVGGRIWELIPECETEEKIVEKLLEEYDVDREVLETDVAEFVAKLRKMNLVE